MWEDLMKTYDIFVLQGCVAPVAHTRVTAQIGIMLDTQSNILAAAKINERIFVPCTAKSECRTRSAEPHLIDDNVSYITDIDPKKHTKYMNQLEKYVENAAPDGSRAQIVYNYLKKSTIINDLKYLLDLKDSANSKLVITFGIAGRPEETIENEWTEYYLSSLPKNGICAITGLPDYIPDAYPGGIRFPGDRPKLMQANNNDKLSSQSQIRPGYIASQKIIHTMQAIYETPKDPHKIKPQDIVVRAGKASE